MPTPIFIVGTTRSGTSWAYDLVASHPDVSMGYESKLPVEGARIYRRWRGRLTNVDAVAGLIGNLRRGVDDPTNISWTGRVFDDPGLPERILAAHGARPGWGTVCEQIFLSKESTTHWGDKMVRMTQAPAIEEHWPDSRFLVLVRDPRAVMSSQRRRFEVSLPYSATYWLTHAERAVRVMDGDPRYRVVDVAKMARDPRPELDWLFREAGLNTEPLDDLIRRYPGDPERLDAWTVGIDPERQRRIEEFCFDLMIELGYAPEFATGPRKLSTFRRMSSMANEYGRRLVTEPGLIRRKRVVSRGVQMLRGGRRRGSG